MNRWNIPLALELEVAARDLHCVYCGVSFLQSDAPYRQRPSWEHITNDVNIVTRSNIARCCISCNASKGAKLLKHWLGSRYCERRGISASTVAQVVRDALIDDEPNADQTDAGIEILPSASRSSADEA
jgi:hypothetical protein